MEDQSKWFLIDWEDAATPPTSAQPSFARASHSPDVFHDGHGPEVDIWAIGYLIGTSTATGISAQLRALGERICKESRELCAVTVLELVHKC